METTQMGMLELSILGALGWATVWILFVFFKTIVYAALSSSTAFSSFYMMTLDVDQALAQPFFFIGEYGFNSVDLVVLLLAGATWVLLGKFGAELSTAASKLSSVLPWT